MSAASSQLQLSEAERAVLDGAQGPGAAMAMRLVVGLAESVGAPNLLPIAGAHIDSCLYHGRSGLDFVHALMVGGAEVQVPTTLNVSSLDLLHPDLYRGDSEAAAEAKELMDGYVSLGCRPTWTCAPYQLEERPALGEHVAWAESNAIVFANSVLGARTERYGDFIDIAAAITGRVPNSGLHQTVGRAATVIVNVGDLSPELLAADVSYPVIGYLIGRLAGTAIPAIIGLPQDTTEDNLKALGAAAAASGSVAMFHAVGLTPEASTIEAACGGNEARTTIDLTMTDMRRASEALTTASSAAARLTTVSVGTPHYSIAEFERLVATLGERRVHPSVDFYVSTGRAVLHEVQLRGWADKLEKAGVTIVVDTCTYITPIVRDVGGVAMTDSAKWAYYAPGNIGVDVVFASLGECVESAIAAEVRRDERLWA